MNDTPTQPTKNYRVSIKALITDEEGRLLMIQERGDHWSIPGGGLEHGEAVLDGLKREIHEELGIEPMTIAETPLFLWTKETAKGHWCLTICYEVTVDSFNFVLENDIRSAQFFSTDELLKLEIDPQESPIAQHYYQAKG